MLPFVFLDASRLGPFHPYGLCVALGFFAWDWAVMRQAKRRGLDLADFRALTIWVLALGAVFAWMVDAVFYRHAHAATTTLTSMQGFSSTGGLCGATLGSLFWRRVRIARDGQRRWTVTLRKTPEPLLPVAEVIVSTWPIAFAFGRLGCTLVHDHPGITVPQGTLASIFAVAWPRGPEDGIDHAFGPLHVVTGGSDARFDLGLVETFVLTAIALGFAATWRRRVRPGTYTIVGTLTYGPIRFALDFLRLPDGPHGEPRLAGLTFAQYFSLAIIALGITLLVRRGRPAALSDSLADAVADKRSLEGR